jgi:hypothetical protein
MIIQRNSIRIKDSSAKTFKEIIIAKVTIVVKPNIFSNILRMIR